jgi:serine/threonine protein kinase
VAIKIYEKGRMLEPNRRRNLKREIQIMKRISHPALVTMKEAFESKKQVFLVQEYVAGGNLQQYLREMKQKMNGATFLFDDADIRSIDSE